MEKTIIEVSVKDTELVIEMISILKLLKEKGSFFGSCIELDMDCDGEDILKRINNLDNFNLPIFE